MSGTVHPAAGVELRVALRELRRRRGLTQRDLLRPLHLASHTAIVDYESGRRIPAVDIIDAYERFFELPSGSLRELRSRALAARAAAEAHRARSTTPGVASVSGPAQATPGLVARVPRQLPPPTTHFAGRVADLAALDRLLATRPTAMIISAIGGMGGVGKTALAVQWAHRVRCRFPDGDLYVNLRGFHPSGLPMPAGEALGLLLSGLGVHATRIPPSTEERIGLYRTLLADRRMLVLLDNAADAQQVRPLLPGTSGCAVLVTSRNRLAGLVARDGAHRIELDVLAPAEAGQLLRDTIGADRTAAEPAATVELAERCGHHPLALRVAAERVAASGAPSIASLVDDLADRDRRMGILAVPDDEQAAVRAVFDWSHDRLSPAAARTFRLLGLHDGPDITGYAVAALCGEPPDRTARALAELSTMHLVTADGTGRFSCHDLLQVYAAHRLRSTATADERRRAAQRLAGWYLHSACAARIATSPSLPPMHPDPVDLPVAPMSFDSPAAALDWFETERANLVSIARRAETEGLHRIGWQLPTAMYGFFDLRKHYADWLATHEIALRCATALDDRDAQGRILCNLGNAYRPMRRDEEAMDCYHRALELFAAVGYRQGEAKVWGNLGSSYDSLKRHDDAAAAHQRSLDIFREIGDRYGEALTLTNVGEMHQRLGRYADSAEHHRRALALFTEIEDAHGVSRATANLGAALARLGHPARALELLDRALAGYRAAGDRYEEANVLANLGDVHSGLGDRDRAVRHWELAVKLFDDIGDQLAAATVRSHLDNAPNPPT